MKKSLIVAATCAAIVAGFGASAALAGEVTGNGKLTQGPLHANSVCSFSGREDAAGSPLRTQTPHAVWLGPEVGVVNPPPGTPGQACRGGSNTGE